MKRILALGLIFIFLLLRNVNSKSKFHHNKECRVADELLISYENYTSYNISFFMRPEDQITIQVSFLNCKKYEDNDLLILKTGSGIIQQKRGGESTSNRFRLNNSIPIGWNSIMFNMKENKIDIGNIYTLKPLEYEICEISFSAKYLTNCTERTPTWNINESDEVYIPLIGLSTFRMSLYSNQPFHPEITLNELDIPLSYDDQQLFYLRSNASLPPQEYRIGVEKLNDTISIYTISENEEYSWIIKAKTKEDLDSLRIRALEGKFILVFDPFHEKLHSGHAIKTVEDQICPECEASSCTLWQITTGLGFGIGVTVSLILSLYLYRTRFVTQKLKVYGVEEGEASIHLLEKDPIKNRIKSEYTETHGQVNKQMNPHHKEVCKIMLKSDKKDDNKKILGDLNFKKPTKVMLVVGETGSGKSSFINGMTNFIYGVTYEDTFRFKLVTDTNGSNISGANTTDELMAYYIPYMPGIKLDCNYILIDTPGFGDSRGLNEDMKWNQKFYDFLNKNQNINEVDGICFVIKATDTRLTNKQEYIINGLFSMFGKDIQKNIYVVVSYSDGSQTHVPKLLQKSGLNYSLALYFNSRAIYSDEETTSDSFESVQNYIKKCWDLNMKHFDHFFNCLLKTTAVSLSLTTVVLEENKDINKIRDEILELMANENYATDQEKQDIQSKIEKNQELLMMKLDEAQKLSGRLENIPAKRNPLVANEYLDMLIKSEQNKDKTLELQKLKERNIAFQKLIKERKRPKSIVNYILGEKTEKTE